MVVLSGVSKVYPNGQKALDNINLDRGILISLREQRCGKNQPAGAFAEGRGTYPGHGAGKRD